MNKKYLLIMWVGSFLLSFQSQANECIEIKAAFDIGSGSTKIKVAKVDICQSKVLEVLLDDSQKVKYKEDLSKNQKSEFSQKIMQQGLQTIQKLKSKAMEFQPKYFVAVATSAFRKAQNSIDFTKKILKRAGILVNIISQEEEARLGFLAGSSKSNIATDQLIIWDIGGGSMQVTTIGKNNNLVSYQGSLGSVPFKNFVITKIQNNDLNKVNTPNPMSKEDVIKSLEFLTSITKKEVATFIKEKISLSTTSVIGTGGVHYYSIRKQVNSPKGSAYTKDQVANTLRDRAGLTDEEIGGPYASTEISNLTLVLGFMQGLNIKAVTPIKTNLTDGLLIDKGHF